jgi:hypothetical protein
LVHLDLHLFQLRYFNKRLDQLENDLDRWLYVLNNGRGLDLDRLPPELQVAEIRAALEAWAMLTQDQIQREIYEAREKARRDAADWQAALQRAAQAEQRIAERIAESSRESRKEGRKEGRKTGRKEGLRQGIIKGITKGEWIGRIRQCEELLGRPPRSDAELRAMPVDALRELADTLRAELPGGS